MFNRQNNQADYQSIVLAALFHDIGKFCERTKEAKENPNLIKDYIKEKHIHTVIGVHYL